MQSQITLSNARPGRTLYVLNAIILVALLWNPAAAGATDDVPGASMFSFSAFGTFGLVHSSEDRADFVANPLQLSGAGYTRSWSPDVDSRLGAQVTAQFTAQLSAMLQVISEQNYDHSFTPHVEWANISYQPTPEFTVRIGRILLPTYLLSDSRKVGYANPWVRPPIEVYDLSPVYDNDGIDASYKMHLGGVVNTLVSSYGKNDFSAPPQGGTLDDNHQWLIADTVEYGSLTLHIAYLRAATTYHSLDAVFDALRQFGPQGTALADQYNLDNKLAQQITAGAMYDPGQWFLMGEWGKRILHSAIVNSTAWYLSGGYRLAKFTPYLTYAEVKADANTSSPGLNVATLPPYLAGPATALNAGLNEILGTNPIQKTASLGFRWDVMKDIDLKMQYDRIALGAGNAGTLTNVQPGFQLGTTVNLFSVAIDFVW